MNSSTAKASTKIMCTHRSAGKRVGRGLGDHQQRCVRRRARRGRGVHRRLGQHGAKGRGREAKARVQGLPGEPDASVTHPLLDAHILGALAGPSHPPSISLEGDRQASPAADVVQRNAGRGGRSRGCGVPRAKIFCKSAPVHSGALSVANSWEDSQLRMPMPVQQHLACQT